MNSAELQGLETSIIIQIHTPTTHTSEHGTLQFNRVNFSIHPGKISINLPDLAPFVMTEVTDSVGSDDEGGEVFMVLSGKLLTVDSGDQPLCRFLGGPEFEWGAIVKKKKTIIF